MGCSSAALLHLLSAFSWNLYHMLPENKYLDTRIQSYVLGLLPKEDEEELLLLLSFDNQLYAAVQQRRLLLAPPQQPDKAPRDNHPHNTH